MRPSTSAAALVALSTLCLLSAVPAAAEGPTKLTVTTVVARARPGPPDASLGALGPMLRRSFPDHKGFTLLGSTTLTASRAKPEAVPLPNGGTLTLTYQGTEQGYVRLDLAIPPRLKTSVRVAAGGTFFQAGLPHDDGILVLAITAVP